MGGNININPPFFYEIAYPFQQISWSTKDLFMLGLNFLEEKMRMRA